MLINFLITRQPPDKNRPVFVEIFRYEGNSQDKMQKVIDEYWKSKPNGMVINHSEYSISRMFTSTNGPSIKMG